MRSADPCGTSTSNLEAWRFRAGEAAPTPGGYSDGADNEVVSKTGIFCLIGRTQRDVAGAAIEAAATAWRRRDCGTMRRRSSLSSTFASSFKKSEWASDQPDVARDPMPS